MADGIYDKGDLIRCSAAFTNASTGTAVDPATVTFRFRKPDGTVTAYVYPTDAQLVKDGTGLYHVDLSLTAVGRWTYRFEGTGTGQSAGEREIVCRTSAF